MKERTMPVVPQVAEGFLAEGVELVVVDEDGGLVEHAHGEVADGAPRPVERVFADDRLARVLGDRVEDGKSAFPG